jgi:hypothetical protein
MNPDEWDGSFASGNDSLELDAHLWVFFEQLAQSEVTIELDFSDHTHGEPVATQGINTE